ncbi:hypothetical protein Trydic_g15821 [Trypoxylus dichotomus]
MLSIWWNPKRVVYFELFPRNRTVHLDVCSQQYLKLDEAIEEEKLGLVNRKGIVFRHDNARPRTSLTTRTRLSDYWKIVLHPPYSPELAPSDYHSFRSV